MALSHLYASPYCGQGHDSPPSALEQPCGHSNLHQLGTREPEDQTRDRLPTASRRESESQPATCTSYLYQILMMNGPQLQDSWWSTGVDGRAIGSQPAKLTADVSIAVRQMPSANGYAKCKAVKNQTLSPLEVFEKEGRKLICMSYSPGMIARAIGGMEGLSLTGIWAHYATMKATLICCCFGDKTIFSKPVGTLLEDGVTLLRLQTLWDKDVSAFVHVQCPAQCGPEP
ncbi:hypothetical protein UY3_12974 [Chelonia mydas]|uniref:Uncharacterized protein n=1 Tax=Chelonia mydas TaxID=8469 RepID=M7AYV8_CHEMY|nr:hypothetical protein UY3_12974 [Chelonia mydas]